jgi:phenylacetate-CoA ligase
MLKPYCPPCKHARIAVLRGDVVKDPKDTKPPFAEKRGKNKMVLSFPHLTPDTVQWYVEALEDFQPDVLWIYPTGGDYLAALMLEKGLKLNIPVIFSSSEMLWPSAWSRLKKAFQGAIVDYYGQAERVCLSIQTRADTGFFIPTYGAVELDPISDSEARIIGTSFWNSKMPLVRYVTGDTVAYPPNYTPDDIKAIGRGEKPFSHIVGRESEYLLTKDGAKIQALNNIARDVQNVLRVQFIQDTPEKLEIRLSLSGGVFDKGQHDDLMALARQRIPDSMAIQIVTDKPLELTKAGKTPFVLRRF